MSSSKIEVSLGFADLLQLAAGAFTGSAADALGFEAPDLGALARITDLPEELLLEYSRELSRDGAERSGELTRLFEGPQPCPPNETAWVRRDKGAILADIAGFYNAFGFEVDPARGEKLDHVSTELEFLSLLLVMHSEADRRGLGEGAVVSREAIERFLRDHLGEWMPGFCQEVVRSSVLPSLQAGARLAGATIERLAGHLGLPELEGEGAGSSEAEEGTPYECGLADACAEQLVRPR